MMDKTAKQKREYYKLKKYYQLNKKIINKRRKINREEHNKLSLDEKRNKVKEKYSF